MLVLGLVGGIGAGKTEVLKLLGEAGAATVAADELARAALQPGQKALQQVREAFGSEFFEADGALRRQALGCLIFSNEQARRKLDDIVHPQMLRLLQERLRQWRRQGVRIAVVEAAVLAEMGALQLVDKVVLVTAPEAVRRQRLQERDGLSGAEARQRLAAHQRLGLVTPPADYVLANAGDREQLRKQVEHLWRKIVNPQGR